MAASGLGSGMGNGYQDDPMVDGLIGATGRFLVVFADRVQDDERAMIAALQAMPGVLNVVSASDYRNGALDVQAISESDTQLFPALGIAVVPDGGDGAAAIMTAVETDYRFEAVEPEQTVYAVTAPATLGSEYLRGYRDAVNVLYEKFGGGGTTTPIGGGAPAATAVDTAAFTWGLQGTGASTSRASGQGVRVAILDTGFDLQHPDFAGRNIVSSSFVPNQAVQDGHGHGTHVTGTSSGPVRPLNGTRRYGAAGSDGIYIGKVLSNQGSGADGQVLAGIDWAITNGCQVISMSLGGNVAAVSPAYEAAGRRALAADCLIVAAAGNSGDRAHGNLGVVGRPANSPSIIAVGAIDSQLQLANFSPRSNPGFGGGIDIVGPGVSVYSSWPMPARYRSISGTSMATPHVAGIAAMWSQVTGATGLALWAELARAAQRLPLLSMDVGAGLVKAPQDD